MMAKGLSFQVTGLQPLGVALAGLSTDMQKKAVRQAVTAGARVIVLAARRNAPVKTGKLKKSIESLRDKQNSRPGFEVRAVSVFKVFGVYANTRENVRKGRVGKKYLMDPPTFYWKFNELGTVKQPARPFIEPALAENLQKVTDTMKAKLAERIFQRRKP